MRSAMSCLGSRPRPASIPLDSYGAPQSPAHSLPVPSGSNTSQVDAVCNGISFDIVCNQTFVCKDDEELPPAVILAKKRPLPTVIGIKSPKLNDKQPTYFDVSAPPSSYFRPKQPKV